jgi:negative regulator of flagellin synthesis FlgM
MKIDSGINNPLAISQTGATRAANKIESTSAINALSATSAASSTVSLSSVKAVQAANSSDIDVAKVAAIKASLQNGTYKIDSGKIADGLINTARDLIKKA